MTPPPPDPRPRVLLTSLGIQHAPSTYVLEGRAAASAFAPAALLGLLDWGPDRVHVLVTDKARRFLAGLERELSDLGVGTVEPVELPDPPDDVEAVLRAIARAIPAGADVRVDLTHSFRHVPVLTLAALELAEFTRDVRVVGIHYGRMDGPFLDLTTLYRLPQWTAAVRSFATTGSALELAALVPAAEGVHLRNLDLAYRAGLPLETGRWAEQVARQGKALRRAISPLPLLAEIAEVVQREIAPLRLAAEGHGWKARVRFDLAEERRQLELVRRHRDRGQVAQAVSLAREWLVSKAVSPAEHWLERKARKRAEDRLNVAERREAHGLVASPEAVELARVWRRLRDDLRNYVQHAGMRRQDALARLHQLEEIAALDPLVGRPLPLPPAPARSLLVTPVGLAPGSVFTAIRRLSEQGIHLDGVLAVGSAESLGRIGAALAAAGFDGAAERFEVEDAHAGHRAALAAVEAVKRGVAGPPRALLEALADTKEVYVNLAGGTTLLGVVAERLAEVAADLGAPVRRFAVADRRSPQEQKQEPYVAGELYWVDEALGEGS